MKNSENINEKSQLSPEEVKQLISEVTQNLSDIFDPNEFILIVFNSKLKSVGCVSGNSTELDASWIFDEAKKLHFSEEIEYCKENPVFHSPKAGNA